MGRTGDRDRDEAERLLKELLMEGMDVHTMGQWDRERTEVWETKVEQLIWHLLEAAGRMGRGQIRS